MRPVTGVMLVLVALVWLITALLKLPGLILGFLMRPVTHRLQFVVEFLYPDGVGRWVHFFILRTVQRGKKQRSDDKNRGYHSRAAETRVEVVVDRVFIHPLPQLLDNLGYLVVCLPEREQPGATLVVEHSNGPLERISVVNEEERRIVAFVVDVGEAEAVVAQVQQISERFYDSQSIEIHSILSTHKHHDHTAGNKALMETLDSIKTVVGGAVERVPECNFPVVNGEMLPLPKYGENNMNDVAQVEVICTPAHTRGSVCYALRPLDSTKSSGLAFLFTGDTMFCAGGGVPFEADIDPDQDDKDAIGTAHSRINASAANHAIERCFAEVLGRSVKEIATGESVSDRVLVFPGHEYTTELLTRQLALSSNESCKWRNFAPNAFFETASQLYVAIHRRSLPHSSGKLLNVPSTVRRELLINPHFRSLAKRGDAVISALHLWYHHFAKDSLPDYLNIANGGDAGTSRSSTAPAKSAGATQEQWNLDAVDIDRPVFTTVYAADLDELIDDLAEGMLTPQKAARRLKEMQNNMTVPPVGRRPIPNTLPTSRTIYKGLLGITLLGSHATALTLSDSRAMELPPPVVGTSDRIRVSKKRLIAVLNQLGLLGEENDGRRLVAIIHQLWKEANECVADVSKNKYDVESTNEDEGDNVDLGMLKWIIYGLGANQPSWFSKYCMPCSKEEVPFEPSQPSAASLSSMKRQRGELVRHDVFSCYLCQTAAGCPDVEEPIQGGPSLSNQPILQKTSSTLTNTEETRPFIEITPETFEITAETLGMHF